MREEVGMPCLWLGRNDRREREMKAAVSKSFFLVAIAAIPTKANRGGITVSYLPGSWTYPIAL